eukprot:g28596.t1
MIGFTRLRLCLLALAGAAPIIRKDPQVWSLTAQGEAERQIADTYFPNCSYLSVSNQSEATDCSKIDVTSCSSYFVLINGVKSVCEAQNGACSDRGDALCCYSLSGSHLCDDGFRKDREFWKDAKRLRRVESCEAIQKRWGCRRSFERYLLGDPSDREIVVTCAIEGKKCVGRSSPASDLACCKK